MLHILSSAVKFVGQKCLCMSLEISVKLVKICRDVYKDHPVRYPRKKRDKSNC